MGTRPFKLQEWRPGDQALFVRNEAYFKSGLPMLDEVQVQVMGDAASMVITLESGAQDVIYDFAFQDVARLKTTPGIRVDQVWGGIVNDTLMNTRQKPFDQKLVRQALAHAVNRERQINIGMAELASRGANRSRRIRSPTTPTWPPAASTTSRRLARLFQQAGLGSGFEFELLASTPTRAEDLARAQVFQSDLAQVGVSARIQDVESADYRERTWGDKYQVAIHGFGRANRDPDTLFRVARAWWPQNNFARL